MDTPEDPGTVTFEQHRRLLLAMGYRMLGSRAEILFDGATVRKLYFLF